MARAKGLYVSLTPDVRALFEERAAENRRKVSDEIALYLEAALRQDPSVTNDGNGFRERTTPVILSSTPATEA